MEGLIASIADHSDTLVAVVEEDQQALVASMEDFLDTLTAVVEEC